MTTRFVFPPPPPAAVPVSGTDQLFPVHRIYCVGKNYAEHAREMGSDPTRDPPFYFAKPADAVVITTDHTDIDYDLILARAKIDELLARLRALSRRVGSTAGRSAPPR